ncbi:MAG: ribonuclease III [Treponema sp.]|nr:MAG: ribonuclease III [Treponema sp.]
MFNFKNPVSNARKKDLLKFQKSAGIRFKDIALLALALKHRSASKEQFPAGKNNERLEFLGDSVLGLVVSSMLFSTLNGRPEGELAKVKSAAVSEESLAKLALELNLDKYLVLGKGEELSGGRKKKAILADALEAVIGALYIDSGFKVAEKFVLNLMKNQISLVQNSSRYADFKSLLQEYVQKHYKTVPKYCLEKTEGPDHDRLFWVSVEVSGSVYGPCSGKSKKEAEQSSAELACRNLKIKF